MSARTKAGRVRLERDIAELGAVVREEGRTAGKREVLAELRRRLDKTLAEERDAAKKGGV